MDNTIIGKPVDRVDGRQKVTGTAQYTADFQIRDVTYAVTVQSTIAHGEITRIDTARAESAPGVLAVYTHENFPKLKSPPKNSESIKLGEKDLLPLQSSTIYYDGQHIAVVVAKTFEQAEHAATLINVEYLTLAAIIEINQALPYAYAPADSMGRKLQVTRGDITAAWNEAPVKLSETYSTPQYTHNPMEPHATVAVWNGDELTLYDSTQAVMGSRDAVAAALGISAENIHLISLFVGGGFGCKGFTWPHTILAPAIARELQRPVKLVLSRQQMFTCNGHRSPTVQLIELGADKDGKFASIKHDVLSETSFVDEFVETAALATQMLYACPNVQISHKLVRLNRGTPTPMRAPGEAPGTFALECALDELAEQLNLDPIELRLRNYADQDPQENKPWSSKNLKDCYQRGADSIGWSKRNPKPRSQPEGNHFIGYGMATATYPASRVPSSARVRIFADGHAEAASSTQDIGTGTYTTMTQITAETLGLPVDKVVFKLGDSDLPKAPVSGGSQTSASVGPAVKQAALAARKKIFDLATADKQSPLNGQSPDNLAIENGRIFAKDNTANGETYADILRRNNQDFVEGKVTTKGTTRNPAPSEKKSDSGGEQNPDLQFDPSQYSFHSFGAQFARVLFDPDLGTIRVTHCTAVMDIGKVLNLKTAINQIMGGMLFGLGMALMEETIYDHDRGRIVTRDLANYLVPVHADVPEIDVQFLDLPDPHITSIGARGIGEIGITGITAAIANAIYNASGKRIRDLPITPDKLI